MFRGIARFALAVSLASAATSRAEESSDRLLERLDELEQEVALLKRQLEVKNEGDAARAKDIRR